MVETLAVRLPNWVGDVCMALPALSRLQRAGFRLHLFGKAWAKDLLTGLNLPITTVARSARAQAQQYQQIGAQKGILFTPSLSSALGMRLANVQAIGYRGDGRSLLLRGSLPAPKPGQGHEVERMDALAKAACARWATLHGSMPAMDLALTPATSDKARAVLDGAKVHAPFAIIAPLAVGTIKGVNKCWPHFAHCSASLHAAGVRLVSCPGPGEEEATAAALPEATIIPDVGLACFAAICKRAWFTLANDSGPAHLAAAVACPTFAIFGPGEVWRTAPWQQQALHDPAQLWPTAPHVSDTLLQWMKHNHGPQTFGPS